MLRQAVELAGDKSEIYAAALATVIGMQEGRTEESIKIIENQLLVRPDNPNLLVAYGLTAQAAGMNDEAEATLRLALSKRADHPMAMHSLATVLGDRGEYEEAEKLACKAFMMVPDHPEFALAAIGLLEAQGKGDVAYEVAALGATMNPQEMELVQKAVEGALAREQTERAWEVLKESDSDLPWVLGWKATLLDHQGRVEEADEILEHGRVSFGDNIAYLILEAAIWARRSKPEQVKPLVEKILLMDPTNRAALRLRADYSLEKAPEQAVADLEAVYNEDPNDSQVAVDLTQAYYKCRRYQDALEVSLYWEQRLTQEPELVIPAQMRVYSALAAASLGDSKDALWRADWIPDEYIVDAITELNTYGSGELAESKLRYRLTDRLPEVEAQLSSDTADQVTLQAPAPAESPAEPADSIPSLIAEEGHEPAGPVDEEDEEYDEDEDHEWIEEDEEVEEEDDDDEYVWVEVDDDEDIDEEAE